MHGNVACAGQVGNAQAGFRNCPYLTPQDSRAASIVQPMWTESIVQPTTHYLQPIALESWAGASLRRWRPAPRPKRAKVRCQRREQSKHALKPIVGVEEDDEETPLEALTNLVNQVCDMRAAVY